MRLHTLAFVFAPILQGCANFGHELHMQDASFTAKPPGIQRSATHATIVFVRDTPAMARVALGPWDAFPLALDGKMVAFLPVGSSVVLHVEPGPHELTWAQQIGNELRGGPQAIRLDARGGAVHHFLLQHAFISGDVRVNVDKASALAAYETSAPAKILHNGVPFDSYRLNLMKKASTGTLAEMVSASMPSSQTINSALEAIGSIALVGLEIAAIVAAAAPQPAAAGVSSQLYGTPRSTATPLRMDTLTSVPRVDRFAFGSSGGGDVLHSPTETRLRDYRTGTVFTIQDGAVRGSDGSRFKVVGNMLYSNSGAGYQIIGNTLRSPDGRTCRRVVETIHCD